MTALVLVPVLYGIFVNAFFLFAAAIWICLLPSAFRDIWRAVRTGDEHHQLRMPDVDRPDSADADAIATRTAQSRW